MKMKKLAAALAISATLAHTAGCGVLLHPERQGQKGGDIDVNIAVLDGIGLFFFLVPGLVAFAVDFYQGTIFLPGTYSGSTESGLEEIQITGPVTEEAIEQALKEKLGQDIDISSPNVQAIQIEREQLGMIGSIARFQTEATTTTAL